MKRLIGKIIVCAVICASMTLMDGCSVADKGKMSLANHMTQKELDEAQETDFMLLDHPWEAYVKEKSGTEFDELCKKIVVLEDVGALVYGKPVFNALPAKDYNGGSGQVIFNHMDLATGELLPEEISFEGFDDLKTKLRAEYDEDIAGGYPKEPADEDYDSLIKLYDATISGQIESIDQQVFDDYLDYYYMSGNVVADTDSFYWQMDDAKVAAIKDNIREYHLYDEELELNFVVHVTLPPAYDEKNSYPALVMTDAVWRFNDVTSIYNAMASGEAEPQLLITIGFAYGIDSWDNEVRGNILCDHKKEFLGFITDNLMPYLGEKYRIDYDSSTLFGHSQGGVFTHYAAFNCDLYENQPFGKYIIGSPTFWTPYFTGVSDYENYKDEYGYFERNDSYAKELLITAGEWEDEDYKEYYGENDSTTEGVKHLEERLEAHGVEMFKVIMYQSHHYQYVSQMLLELVKDVL